MRSAATRDAVLPLRPAPKDVSRGDCGLPPWALVLSTYKRRDVLMLCLQAVLARPDPFGRAVSTTKTGVIGALDPPECVEAFALARLCPGCEECPQPGKFCICDDVEGNGNIERIRAHATAMIAMGDMIYYVPNAVNLHF